MLNILWVIMIAGGIFFAAFHGTMGQITEDVYKRQVEGLEYQEEFAKMAERSVKMNGQEEKVHIVQGDVRNIKTDYERESFDWVTCNPPYMTGEHGLTNPDYAKAIARHEITCSLEDVVKAAKWLLKTGGHFYICLLYTSRCV